MPSAYLQSSEYSNYGLSGSTTSAQVTMASSLIDGYLQRREGLLWSPDANGNPCYMSALSPMITLTASSGFSPGQNVSVRVTGAVASIALGSSQSGLVAIVDRANPSLTEACVVNAVNGNTITLSNVQFTHSSNALLEFGLVIFEEKQMPVGRPITMLTRWPVQMILAGQGRYGYARRSSSGAGAVNEYNLLAAITKFGGPPVWEIFDQTKVGVDPVTGAVWAPAGILLAYYTEIRFSYIAGYTYASLPSQIKQACANIITASSSMPINGSIKSQRAGDTEIVRFAATNLDQDTKDMLEPYKVRAFV